jgi:hypothetical protein
MSEIGDDYNSQKHALVSDCTGSFCVKCLSLFPVVDACSLQEDCWYPAGGKVSLYYDGKKVGEGRVERTQPMAFSADETTDVGRDTATPVSSDYTRNTSEFNGKVNWVQIDLGKDTHDHFITPEERLNLAMAKQ